MAGAGAAGPGSSAGGYGYSSSGSAGSIDGELKPKEGVGVTEGAFTGSSRKDGVVASYGRGRAADGRTLGAFVGAPWPPEARIVGALLGAALRAAIFLGAALRAAIFFLAATFFFAGLRDADFATFLRVVARPLAAAFFFAGAFFRELRAVVDPFFRAGFFLTIVHLRSRRTAL
jgi:hypothetical protein